MTAEITVLTLLKIRNVKGDPHYKPFPYLYILNQTKKNLTISSPKELQYKYLQHLCHVMSQHAVNYKKGSGLCYSELIDQSMCLLQVRKNSVS